MAVWVCHYLFSEFENKVGVEFHEELLPEHEVAVTDGWIDQEWGVFLFFIVINSKHIVLRFENSEPALGLSCGLLNTGEQQIVFGIKPEALILERIQSQQRHALEIVPAAAAHPVLFFWGPEHVTGLVDETLAEVVEVF